MTRSRGDEYAGDSLLRISGLRFSFDRNNPLLERVELSCRRGEVYALIGANGVGKTTLLNLLNGYISPTAGNISFCGRSLVGLRPHLIAQLGVARTFQTTQLVGSFTVFENLTLAASGAGLLKHGQSHSSLHQTESDVTEGVVQRLGIEHLLNRVARSLSFGEQKLCALACAVVRRPTLFLLDEPVAGVAPSAQIRVATEIGIQAAEGRSVIMIEHNFSLVRTLSAKVVIIRNGRVEAFQALSDVDAATLRES